MGEQVPDLCKWLMVRWLGMEKWGFFEKSNRSRTGHFGVKNVVSKKLMKIEQVAFKHWFSQVVAREWVARILGLTKGPVRTGPRGGRKMREALGEQVTLTLKPTGQEILTTEFTDFTESGGWGKEFLPEATDRRTEGRQVRQSSRAGGSSRMAGTNWVQTSGHRSEWRAACHAHSSWTTHGRNRAR